MKRKIKLPSNLTELSSEEIQKVELDVLKFLADFCEKNNINYILSDGTLIGAVRHKGFIPWDLDIDISMLRTDYDRFLSLWTDTEDYALVSIKNVPDCALSFAKIVDLHTICYEDGIQTARGGLWIDIFPLDAVPKGESEITTHYNKITQLFDSFGYISFIHRHKSLFSRLLRRIKYAFKYSDISYLWEDVFTRFKRLLKESVKYNLTEYDNVTNNMVIQRRTENRKYGFPKTTLTDYIYASFENFSFRIPKDYDSLLRSFYGDYMQLPPENERVDHHNLKAFRKPE